MSAKIVGWSDYLSLGHLPGQTYDWHILAEGDSWFHFGFTPIIGKPRNLLDPLEFKKSTVIANLALAGDTIQHISDPHSNPVLLEAVGYRKWHLILLSAGGNDLIDALTGNYQIDGNKIEIIKSGGKTGHFISYIDSVALEALLNHVEKYYIAVSELRNTLQSGITKDTKIVTHCYDYITPRNAPAKIVGKKFGPWAYKALKQHAVPPGQWGYITDYLFERLADRLLQLPSKINNMHVINTLSTLHAAELDTTGDSNDWMNEIHPNPDGYKKLGDKKVSPFIVTILK